MAQEKKDIKPAWASKKYLAGMMAAWGPVINHTADLGVPQYVLVLFVISLLLTAALEFGLDLARIITGRGGPSK
jgi:hypothetical protein